MSGIMRKGSWVDGYIKSDGTVVKGHYRKSSLVPDTGKPGKTAEKDKVLPKPDPKGLSKYGYHDIKKMSAADRHVALKKAVKSEGYSVVSKRMNLIANYTKLSNPSFHQLLKRDLRWLKKEFKP